jgi:hypothetical protein
LGDLRFRVLLGNEDWHSLLLAARKRFSKRLAGQESAVYKGEVIHTRMTGLGWCLAQLTRLIGAPLPLSRDAPVPAIVTVTEDPEASSGAGIITGAGVFRRLSIRQSASPGPRASRNMWGASAWRSPFTRRTAPCFSSQPIIF